MVAQAISPRNSLNLRLKTQRTVQSRVVSLAAIDLRAMVSVEPASSHSTLPARYSLADVRRELRAALDAQGYTSCDSVVALVQDVKHELAAEQDARSPEKA